MRGIGSSARLVGRIPDIFNLNRSSWCRVKFMAKDSNQYCVMFIFACVCVSHWGGVEGGGKFHLESEFEVHVSYV